MKLSNLLLMLGLNSYSSRNVLSKLRFVPQSYNKSDTRNRVSTTHYGSNTVQAKQSLFILFSCLVLVACNDFDQLNIDPKQPEIANPDFLFTAATKQFADWSNSTNTSENAGYLAAQYFTQVETPQESRYDWQSKSISENIWREIYLALANWREARQILETTEFNPFIRDNKTACITVMEALTYQTLVDLFGNVPYSEEVETFPVYQDVSFIYTDLLEKLDVAIRAFDVSYTAFGEADLIYQGDVAAWKRFANAMKLRLGIRLTEINPELARRSVESAIANTFTSNADNVLFQYRLEAENSNPFRQAFLDDTPEYVLSNTLTDYMNTLRDPRRRHYMTRDLAQDSKYIGKEYGSPNDSNFRTFSQINPSLVAPDFAGQFITFTEIAFILAEAAERGWNADGKASDWYNTAVTASILQWGGTTTEAEDYLKNGNVAYGKAENGDNLKTIALQKWISLYPNGYQAWTEWRRLDYPNFNVPEGLSEADFPMRHTYPQSEARLNETNYTQAVNSIGSDDASVRVFWDVR